MGSKNYDNWERLVGAVLRREQFRQMALRDSRNSSIDGSESSSTFSFSFNEDRCQSFYYKHSEFPEARKTPSTESIDSSAEEEELAIRRLEIAKNDLRQRIAKEAKGNAILQASLERRKQALHERRLALEQDVARLQEQLQAERDLHLCI